MDKPIPYCNPEVWGGVECTINRIDHTYIDQLHLSGHYYREGDIGHIAAMGIKKLRYPILWEKHEHQKNIAIDWQWTEKQLEEIRAHKIDIIAGLIHHGSGPAFTNLTDPQFPYLLADYAGRVAEKFPWIEFYTPVNEPLTTSRFSGLYGFWYPHMKQAGSFIKMLLHELKGTVLAMKAIRNINPNAKLLQTEDLGKTYSTKTLQYQADFENERRWLTYDILCGRFNEKHPLWKYVRELGIPESDLRFFLDNPCTPDIFGFNHYLTSERFLDERLHLYPSHTHGGNGRHVYADVEAVRVNVNTETGIEALLKEAWMRYRKPMAVTEVHLHCHREEQLRWFKHVWHAANHLTEEGIDIRAVTSWALLGSYGWNKLLTEEDGDYEPGAFDLRNGTLRKTALSKYITTIAHRKESHHHLTDERGWWQRESRLLYETCNKTVQMTSKYSAPLLIIGKNGTLGKAFARICEERCINYYLLSREDCDISILSSIEKVIEQYKPWGIINAAGYVRVDDAENDCEACTRDNTTGPHKLAIACQGKGIQLVNFSSDLVFDGQKPIPYLESDLPNPLNIYGKSKAQAELLVQKECPGALIIRTSAFFGPWDEYNFVHYIQKSLSQYEQVLVAKDIYISPTYVPHLVNATLDLIIDGESGIWHLANKGSMTWSELAFKIADRCKLDPSLILPVNAVQLNYPAKRPYYTVLGSERGYHLPSFESALDEYIQHRETNNRKVA